MIYNSTCLRRRSFIFKGNIRRFDIKKIDFNGSKIKILEYETPIVKKDALFYVNMVGNIISFDYDTKLANVEEARDVSISMIKSLDQDLAKVGCIFFNENELVHSESLNRHDFKVLKKEFKKKYDNRKNN